MRKGTKRDFNRISVCKFCNERFSCADPKASRCEKCRKCPDCGIKTRSKTRYCKKCQGKHKTILQENQLKNLHASICGNNNPSKRPEVKLKLSESKKGDKNPARIYREQYAAHIKKYRPNKISKLEILFSTAIPDLKTQYKIDGFRFDLVDEQNQIAIEIQGCWFHSCSKCFPQSPQHPTQFKTKANDIKKQEIIKEKGWILIEIAEHEIRGKSNDEIRDLYKLKRKL